MFTVIWLSSRGPSVYRNRFPNINHNFQRIAIDLVSKQDDVWSVAFVTF